MFHAKKEVLRLFLRFVGSYTSLTGAKLATLGGEGLEAELWKEENIAPTNGWLIECVLRKSKHLMAKFPYRHCSRLAHFRRMAESIWGARYGIDGFHLDLCGTYERSDADFRPAIPLIMRGTGRCLAITVADQRRNTSQENFADVRRHSEQWYDNPALADALFQKVLSEYRALPTVGIGLWADPASGTEREMGFAFHLLKALHRQSTLQIDRIERHLYVSSNKGRPFRMRTYFLHFGGARSKGFVSSALELWRQSPLLCVTKTGIIPICSSTTMEVVPMKSYQNLQKLAESARGLCLEEFNALIADADYGRRVRAVPYDTTSEPVPAAISPVPQEPVIKNGKSLHVQLDMLRAAVEGPKKLAVAKENAAKALGLKGKSKKRSVGSFYARTQGSFRPKFLKTLAKHGMLKDVLVNELADIYSKLAGQGVTSEQLRQEAQS